MNQTDETNGTGEANETSGTAIETLDTTFNPTEKTPEKTMEKLIWLSIIFSALALVAGFSLAGRWPLAIGAAALGAIWLLGQHQAWPWIASVGLVAFTGLAAAGVWLRVAPISLLLAMVAALAAWDLSQFSRRLARTTNLHHLAAMKQIHDRRLLLTLALGLLFGLAALTIRVQLSFGWAVLLALLMVASLSWVIGQIRRSGER